jgi:Predicted carbamoyl transferase, NodU family
MGKIHDWFPQLKGIFIPPVPYDGGLTIGAAQHTWHHVMGNQRVKWDDNVSPYLGETYALEQVTSALDPFLRDNKLIVANTSDDEVVELLATGNIVSVFNCRAESGRRALGNRSILADPRDPAMKDRVNEKVKHRQWYRPFAPSIIREAVPDIFERDVDSPYMGFVLKFKEEMKSKLPAVVHFDGTARLQTVTERDNPWYHAFLKKWGQKSGYPIILNTSFNDREPICETPVDAIKCFLGTEIDYLYFPEHNIICQRVT